MLNVFFVAFGLFHKCVLYNISIWSVVSRTLTPGIFDYVFIACSLESIKPVLFQGCKALNDVGYAYLITSSESGPTEQ